MLMLKFTSTNVERTTNSLDDKYHRTTKRNAAHMFLIMPIRHRKYAFPSNRETARAYSNHHQYYAAATT